MTPQQVNSLMLWEWQALVKGWQEINGPKSKPAYPTDDEFEQAIERIRFH